MKEIKEIKDPWKLAQIFVFLFQRRLDGGQYGIEDLFKSR